MNISVLKSEKLSASEISAWRAICAGNPAYQSPYFTPDFFQIVSKVRDDVKVIVAKDNNDNAVGFFPVQVSGVGLKLARPIGAPFSDYNGPILELGYEDLASQMLSECGAAVYSLTGIQVIDAISELPSDKTEIDDIRLEFPVFSKMGLSVRGKANAFVADLSSGYDAYLEAQRSAFPKHFKKSRRLWRQAEKEAGKLELAFHEASIEALEQLIHWKQEQFLRTGLHDVLAPDWSQNMLKKCLDAQSSEFAGVLTTLRCDGELIAAEFGLRSGTLLHGWISGYNADFHQYSPGMLLQTRLLEAAAENGILTADLGVGAEHYKKYYASRFDLVCSGIIPATNSAGALRGIGGEVWHQLENAPLGPISKFAGKLRRRLDVIFAVEQGFSARKNGVIQAFKKT